MSMQGICKVIFTRWQKSPKLPTVSRWFFTSTRNCENNLPVHCHRYFRFRYTSPFLRGWSVTITTRCFHRRIHFTPWLYGKQQVMRSGLPSYWVFQLPCPLCSLHG